ncbi:MAG TPA: hypothetical protein VMF60_07445 [Acidimicrobiales bacterium]|nr:hypothetical protein [Acidimicrobiales bacterium]
MGHARKVLVLAGVFVLYFVLFGAVFGFHRLNRDFWPLDQSVDGPNVYASFIWLPIAFVGGWIGGEIRSARNLEKQRLLLEEHAKHIDQKLLEHHLKMAELLGVADKSTADTLNATPGDRALDSSS